MTTRLVQIITPADLKRLAGQLHEHVARTGDVAETHVQLPAPPDEEKPLTFQIILRPGPKNQIQLATVGWGRYWPQDRRAELCQAFGSADPTLYHCNIIRGWQIIKWTWTRETPVQDSFLPPAEEKSNQYQQGY